MEDMNKDWRFKDNVRHLAVREKFPPLTNSFLLISSLHYEEVPSPFLPRPIFFYLPQVTVLHHNYSRSDR